MLATLRDRAEARLSELSREYFMHHAGYKPDIAMAPIVRRYDDLLAPEAQATIRTAWEAATDAVEKRSLGYLYGDCLRNVLRRDLAEAGDVLGQAEAKATVEFEGQTYSYPQASVAVGNSGDRERRRRLAAAVREVSAGLNGPRAALLSREHELIQSELGFADYTAFYGMVRGIDFAGMAPAMEAFLAATQDAYTAMMEPWAREVFGLGLDQLETHDLTFLRRASRFDAYFPAEKLVPSLNATLSGMGLPPEALESITMDLENRPGKSSRAFCMGVRIPGEVYLCITPGGGPDDFQALYHEMGHALHFGHASAALPFEFRFAGDNSVCEAFAFVMEHITLEAAWLAQHVEMPAEAAADYRRHMARMRFLNLRRFAAKHLYELALHDGAPIEGKGERYAAMMSAALGIRHFPEDYLASTDGGYYTAQYFRAWCLEAQLKQVLKARFGEAWFENPAAGAFMRELWALGQSLPGDELARHLGFDGISPEAALADIALSL